MSSVLYIIIYLQRLHSTNLFILFSLGSGSSPHAFLKINFFYVMKQPNY